MLIGKDNDLRSAVQNELGYDEQILWIGTPNPLRMLLKDGAGLATGILMLVIFFFFFRGFNITFTGFGLTFPMFSVIFYVFIATAFAAPLWEFYKATQTIYAVTSGRLLIITRTPFGQSVKSYTERDIERVERREHSGGQGDLIFAQEQRSRRRRSYGRHYYTVDVGFFGIPNVRNVEEIVLETFKL